MRILAHFIISFVLTILVMMIWLMLANANEWLFFTGWGMAHGGFVVALPISWFISFGGLFLVPWLRKGWQRGN